MEVNRKVKGLLTPIIALLIPLLTTAADRQTPVVIACDWDFAPYEFINSDGEVDGFNIDIIDAILTAQNIPHKFVMGSRKQSLVNFKAHKADLIIDYSNRFTGEPYYRSLNVLEYSNIVIAYRKGTPQLSKVSQLQGRTVMVNGSNDSIAKSPLAEYLTGAFLDYHTAREALGGIENGQMNYFVWGKELLEWKIKEYDLHNVVVGPLDIPVNEIHIVGYDKELVETFDNQFARMQQSGQIDLMRDRWFHPEQLVERTSPVVVYFLLGALLLSFLIYAIYRIARNRVRKALRHNQMTEAMMRQALSMGRFSVFVNNLRHKRVTNSHGSILPPEGITSQQLMERVHPDDRDVMMARPEAMQKTPGQSHPFTMRWNVGTPEKPQWTHVQGYSFAEMKHHRPENIVIVSRDVTEQVLSQQRNRELTERYMKMFDSTLLAMSFYDKEGRLINLNENMKKLCGLDEQRMKFFWTTRLFDTDMMKGEIDPASLDDFHTCQHMYYPEKGIDKHIELTVHPIADENKRLQYYVVTSRDATAERHMYLELHKQSQALSDASQTNQHYEKELRTMLENSNMYVWHADPKMGTIAFSRSLQSGEEFTETFKEYLGGMADEDRPHALENIQHIYDIKAPFNVVHCFNHTPVTDVPTWFAVSGMPLFDENGRVKSLFGLVRDITHLMEAQERLKEETARAENSAMLKSTFLANMTHEIRTPLNAIVGFSDLLQAVDTPEERKEFIRIIRNNCDMLLRLINDIFEASTMDVKPLSIVPKKVDFAKEFAVVCQSLAQRVQDPNVKFIADQPYDSLVTTLDMGRMQQVITNFVTNAVKYTQRGHIRVGYCLMTEDSLPDGAATDETTTKPNAPKVGSTTDAEVTIPPREGLYIFCEDTGTGIPKNKQTRVFDRFVKLNDFVQGTGLGLAISKSIAYRCNGHIGLVSEGEGCGSTFWIWVPCTIS